MTKLIGRYLLASLALLAGVAYADSADTQSLIQEKLNSLRWLSNDSQVVAAVQDYNAHPSASAQGMTNDKWENLTVLDPFIRSLTKTPVMTYLKEKKDPAISELFISGADGGKVGFLGKTTSWTHKGKPKHEKPMEGKDWIGTVEVDSSSGVEQVQVALPVLEGGKPIGSVVVGLAVNRLRQ